MEKQIKPFLSFTEVLFGSERNLINKDLKGLIKNVDSLRLKAQALDEKIMSQASRSLAPLYHGIKEEL